MQWFFQLHCSWSKEFSLNALNLLQYLNWIIVGLFLMHILPSPNHLVLQCNKMCGQCNLPGHRLNIGFQLDKITPNLSIPIHLLSVANSTVVVSFATVLCHDLPGPLFPTLNNIFQKLLNPFPWVLSAPRSLIPLFPPLNIGELNTIFMLPAVNSVAQQPLIPTPLPFKKKKKKLPNDSYFVCRWHYNCL